MRRSVARLKGLGFILWHTRHEFYHVLVGLVWAWFLREIWREFNPTWVILSVVGSLLPDLDHFIYFVTYGKKDWYTIQIRAIMHKHQWRNLWKFVETGHKKYQTNLATHNYYFMAYLCAISLLSFFVAWKVGMLLFGSMLLHYLFDVTDDIVNLGYVNSNWRRWWKPKKITA